MDVNVSDKVNEFPVGSEQNPAKNWAELPDGAGLVVRVQRDGTRCKQWYKNGGYHRVDGPAVESENGSQQWYLNGDRHRVDGPAVIYVSSDGSVDNFWYQNNVLHRVDGPAAERANGTKEYWLYGEYMNETEFLERTKKNTNTIRHEAD